MTQTWAILVDAYRDLNSRKMFWVVLVLSVLFAGAFACVNMTPTGLKVLVWNLPFGVTSRDVSNAALQKGFFFYFGIQWWLTWIASILALISTAGIFPSLIAGGAVELYLSKPIGRFRLFLTKYIFGLLFVALQMACYCAASFLAIGLRGGEWEPAIFIAIPLILLFYSFLYCVCVLVGVVTRSTVAAILFTLLFWVFVWAVAYTEKLSLTIEIASKNEVRQLDRHIESLQTQIDRAQVKNIIVPTTQSDMEIVELKAQMEAAQAKKTDTQGTGVRWHDIMMKSEYVLPKTSATIALLQRELIDRAKLPVPGVPEDSDTQRDGQLFGDMRGPIQAEAEIRNRSIPWTIGTSLAFEAVVVLLSAWIFCRRDY